MTKRNHEDDIIIHVIVIISILISILIDTCRGLKLLLFSGNTIQTPGKIESLSNTTENHKCLTSQNSSASTPSPTKLVSPFSDTTHTRSGNTKRQRPSPSTKRRSTTADQRKVAGGTKQDSLSSPTASSPRSRRSKPSSNTSMNMRSQTSPALETQRRTTITKSTSPMTSPKPILSNVPTTADDSSLKGHATSIDHQST